METVCKIMPVLSGHCAVNSYDLSEKHYLNKLAVQFSSNFKGT